MNPLKRLILFFANLATVLVGSAAMLALSIYACFIGSPLESMRYAWFNTNPKKSTLQKIAFTLWSGIKATGLSIFHVNMPSNDMPGIIPQIFMMPVLLVWCFKVSFSANPDRLWVGFSKNTMEVMKSHFEFVKNPRAKVFNDFMYNYKVKVISSIFLSSKHNNKNIQKALLNLRAVAMMQFLYEENNSFLNPNYHADNRICDIKDILKTFHIYNAFNEQTIDKLTSFIKTQQRLPKDEELIAMMPVKNEYVAFSNVRASINVFDKVFLNCLNGVRINIFENKTMKAPILALRKFILLQDIYDVNGNKEILPIRDRSEKISAILWEFENSKFLNANSIQHLLHFLERERCFPRVAQIKKIINEERMLQVMLGTNNRLTNSTAAIGNFFADTTMDMNVIDIVRGFVGSHDPDTNARVKSSESYKSYRIQHENTSALEESDRSFLALRPQSAN